MAACKLLYAAVPARAAARSLRHCVVSQPKSSCVDPYATFNAKTNAAKKKKPTDSFMVISFLILLFFLFAPFTGNDPSCISASAFVIAKRFEEASERYLRQWPLVWPRTIAPANI